MISSVRPASPCEDDRIVAAIVSLTLFGPTDAETLAALLADHHAGRARDRQRWLVMLEDGDVSGTETRRVVRRRSLDRQPRPENLLSRHWQNRGDHEDVGPPIFKLCAPHNRRPPTGDQQLGNSLPQPVQCSHDTAVTAKGVIRLREPGRPTPAVRAEPQQARGHRWPERAPTFRDTM
jgi:hypothetical protein